MHALLIGATGATGKDLLNLLLKDDAVHRVDILVRHNPGLQHGKLKVHVIDFNNSGQWKHLVKGDVFFSSLGTTLKAAGSKEAQWKIDFDYQHNFAKAARENNVGCYVLVSSDFASPNSPFYYAKMKGQLEVAVKELGFPSLTICKPPMLIRKNSNRTGEVVGLKLIKLFNKTGLFSSQKPLPTEVLAQAMLNAAKTNAMGIHTLKSKDIWQLAAIAS